MRLKEIMTEHVGIHSGQERVAAHPIVQPIEEVTSDDMDRIAEVTGGNYTPPNVDKKSEIKYVNGTVITGDSVLLPNDQGNIDLKNALVRLTRNSVLLIPELTQEEQVMRVIEVFSDRTEYAAFKMKIFD